MKPHLAELLLEIRFRNKSDKMRSKRPFSEDIAATNSILFNPAYDRKRKIKAYWAWLARNQPCIFGRMAATQKKVFICLLEEKEILTMRKGDEDLRQTIQDHRQVWKRYAIEGLSSSFVILLISPSLVLEEPSDRLKEISRRLLELYMELPRIDDDSIIPQREYVHLRTPLGEGKERLLKFGTLPNVFCTQADGRWWHDHRTPGGVMITSNALGHHLYSQGETPALSEKKKLGGLEQAMRTIQNAFRDPPQKRGRIKHCPATFLVPRQEAETCPVGMNGELAKLSPNTYHGYFHTDHLIPSIFFKQDRDPAVLKLYNDLSLKYIHDAEGDPQDHKELVTGIESTWYEAKRDLDRLPEFADPETNPGMPVKTQGRLKNWLEQRLKERTC